jgi:hypothetical protein
MHGGQLSDSRYGTRMRGEGNIADSIHQLFSMAVKKHMPNKVKFQYDLSVFERPKPKKDQLDLFD